MTEEPTNVRPTPLWRLWFGVLGPPLLWAIQLNVAYFLVTADCLSDLDAFRLVLGIVSVVVLVLDVIAGVISFAAWRHSGVDGRTDLGGAGGSSGALALLGLMLSLVFAFAIVLTGASQLLVPLC